MPQVWQDLISKASRVFVLPSLIIDRIIHKNIGRMDGFVRGQSVYKHADLCNAVIQGTEPVEFVVYSVL